MTSDFLTDLDAAVEGRCACRCGSLISAVSPSAYFASERCADRWHGRRPLAPAPLGPEALMRALQAVFDHGTKVVTIALRAFEEAIAPLADHLCKLAVQVQPLTGEQPPTDPWERALWLRRHRNTGPRPAPQCPRRIDPGSGLRVVAQGRPVYHPMR